MTNPYPCRYCGGKAKLSGKRAGNYTRKGTMSEKLYRVVNLGKVVYHEEYSILKKDEMWRMDLERLSGQEEIYKLFHKKEVRLRNSRGSFSSVYKKKGAT